MTLPDRNLIKIRNEKYENDDSDMIYKRKCVVKFNSDGTCMLHK